MTTLTAGGVADATNELKSILGTNPADGAALIAAMTSYDGTQLNGRLIQVLTNAKQTIPLLSAGDVALIDDALAQL
ncbi:hypothetical protein [Methylomarinum vadi]|uniref:hypothetical protein n=1 Tax=Methylomarinum vadi TaxID=438855 RepID=UPI0004DFAD57|nr:hypothetical protein [Methylomarinum vadi]